MQTAEARVLARELSGVRSELAAVRRGLLSQLPKQRPVDLRPMRGVTQARLMMAVPGFVGLWKARVPPERVAGTSLLSGREAAWAVFCSCGRQLVVPRGHVARCADDEHRCWFLGIADAVLVKRWTPDEWGADE